MGVSHLERRETHPGTESPLQHSGRQSLCCCGIGRQLGSLQAECQGHAAFMTHTRKTSGQEKQGLLHVCILRCWWEDLRAKVIVLRIVNGAYQELNGQFF